MVRYHQRQLDPALTRSSAHTHPPGSERGKGIGKAPQPLSLERGWRRDHDRALQFLAGRLNRVAERTKVHAKALVERVHACKGAMNVDRPVVSRLAKQLDHPLGLSQRIRAHEVCPFGELRSRFDEATNLTCIAWMPEDREAEGRL